VKISLIALGSVLIASGLGCAPTTATEIPGQAVNTEYVRIPRRLFEPGWDRKGSGQGQVKVSGQLALESPLEWREDQPQDQDETGSHDEVLADFSDTTGCLELVSTGSGRESAGVCFRIMPDVSSVGLNARDAWLQNPASISSVASLCPQSAPKKLDLRAAQREGEIYRAVFADSSGTCPVEVEVSLRF